MYNPREGKLRRNKYFNLGYENASGWEARKALADCITAYVDMGDPPHIDNSERAMTALRQFTRGSICKTVLNAFLAEAEFTGGTVVSLIYAALEFDGSEIASAAEMLRLLNSEALKVEPRIKPYVKRGKEN